MLNGLEGILSEFTGLDFPGYIGVFYRLSHALSGGEEPRTDSIRSTHSRVFRPRRPKSDWLK